MSISEVHGMADETVAVVPLVAFVQEGVDDRGRVLGCFKGTGKASLFSDHIRSHGRALPEGLFSRSVQVD